jgi:hypothetical protein
MTMVSKISESAAVARAGALGLCAGANLRTPCGGRRVENIRNGDLIVTRDNGLQPVRMVWRRTVTAAEIAADPSLAPVRLKPRAIGPMMPQRDLLVGAAHRVLIPGWRLQDVPDTTACLIPARDVAGVNDAAYVDRSADEVTYFNVVFDSHQVFSANGLPVESFLPTVTTLCALDRHVTDDITRLFPELLKSPSAYPPAEYPTPEAPRYRPDFA